MTSPIVADLHVHTTASDGTLPLTELPGVAKNAGLQAVAVTDHDLLHPDLDQPVTVRDGITIVRGLELKVELPSKNRLDLLGYAVHRTERLDSLLDELQSNRMGRARRMRGRLEDHLGVELEIAIEPGIGRPHLARAVARHPETEYDLEATFARLIGDDKPCYVPRSVPSIAEARSVLTEACPVIAVAHPLRAPDVEEALELAADLGAVERWYPYGEQISTEAVERLLEEHEILPTGGSDAHDRRLGRAGLDVDSFEQVWPLITE